VITFFVVIEAAAATAAATFSEVIFETLLLAVSVSFETNLAGEE
jgi:hypothetical protein